MSLLFQVLPERRLMDDRQVTGKLREEAVHQDGYDIRRREFDRVYRRHGHIIPLEQACSY